MTEATCSDYGCGLPVKARGLCMNHYMYGYRHGTLPPLAPKPSGCSEEGCPNPHMARGLCAKHYHRVYKRGTVKLTEPERQLPDEERFWAKVSPEPCSCGHGCRLWTAGKQGVGYGTFYWNGRRQLAHRVAYELVIGPVPPLHQVDHVRSRGCRHRNCVNPEHLEAVSLEENVRRAQVGERARNGEKTRVRLAATAMARFWAKVDKSAGLEAHWPWQTFTDQWGHAKVWWQGTTHMAREVAWLLSKEVIPDGFVVDQSCGEPACVNPGHMTLITQAEHDKRRTMAARATKAANRPIR